MSLELSAIRTLVVDDHESMRSILSAILRALGFRILRSAKDGVEALRTIPVFRPDLIITDLRMPIMDGITLVRQLRADETNPFHQIPIIMVTGHAHEQNVRAAWAAGINEFLAKPVTGRDVADRIRRVIEDDRPFVRTEDYIGPARVSDLQLTIPIPAPILPRRPLATPPAEQTPGSAPCAAPRPAA